MANYYATARSNYFRVKDAEAFKAWADKRGLGMWAKKVDDGETLFAVYTRNDDSGGWPSSAFDDEVDDYVDFDIFEEVSAHLVEGDVAVFMEVGSESMRYLCGFARAVNAAGKVRFISLEDEIMQKAKKMGTSVTACTY